MSHHQPIRIAALIAAMWASAGLAFAQPPAALTAADYARAEKFMPYNVNPLVYHGAVRATWLADERFWYRVTVPEGTEFILVDPARGTRAPAFDQARLAQALSTAANAHYEAFHLPFQQFEFTPDGKSITFSVNARRWTCDVTGSQCAAAAAAAGGPMEVPRAPGGGRDDAVSPDGKRVAFIRADNLWVREVATRKETQLTTDGVKDFGYATDNAGWVHSERPIVLWSPDSKKIATFQQDQRKVGEMYLVDTRVGHPRLQAWKYPLPGDDDVSMIQRVVIDIDAPGGPRVVRLKMPPDQHRSTLCDHVACRNNEWADVEWNPEGTQLAFVSTSRDHKREQVRIADAVTGDVRDVFEEKVDTYYESGNGTSPSWRYLPATSEFIWFSERDGWGQLYLYDAKTGAVKKPITTGDGNVVQLLKVDEKARMVWFTGVGKEKGQDPYFRNLYRVSLDGQHLQRLTPEDADHDISLSSTGRYFVDVYSKPDVAPVSVLRSASDGKVLVELERADISKLLATGWKPPMPFTVKARDGVTDLYGLLYRPTQFDQAKKYPIVNKIYPGPQTGSVGSRSFAVGGRGGGDQQALAELGFVVVELDGMGTPWRSKKFHDAYYGNMGDNTLPDQVTGMKQLAQKYSWIDIDRAGIWGHSGGGYAAADAMFRYPEFFKVGISEAGNHDNRVYEDDWGEKWQGLLERKSDDATNYDSQANQNFARNLKGHLLLAHGTLDDNVPPNNTMLVVNALIKANKDFDLLLLPNRRHGFGSEPYMVRRRWDYFVRYLLGAEPPKEYELKPPSTPAGPPSSTGASESGPEPDAEY